MRRVIFIPCVLLLVLGVVAYFSSVGALRGSGRDRPIVLCNADEMKTLDVGQMSWQSEIRTAMALWEGLTSYDRDTLKPVPGVAESWDLSADGKTYTFHLRKDAKWSNGDSVVAGDFIFAWKRVFLPSTGANYVSFFNLIEGGEEYADLVAKGKPADFSKVGVESPDRLTLIVHLKYPRGYFLDLCAFPPFFPLNEKSMRPFLQDASDPSKGYTEKWTRPPSLVTNGAFFLKDWKFKQYMLLEPNENYWDRGNVKCKQLVIKAISDPRAALLAYQSGAVDIYTFVPPQFGQDLLQQVDEGRKDVHYMPVFGAYYYIFNCTRPPLTDKRVRKALSLAVDRKKIADEVVRMRERPLGVIVPPDSIPGYVSPKGLEMDVAEAKRLLAEAGFPEGKGMRSIELLYNTEAIHERVAQAVGQMWEQNLGVHVTYRGLEKTGFAAERQETHNFDVGRAGWYGDYADPTTWLDLVRTGNSNNDGLFSNKEYDGLMDKAFSEGDPVKRLGILSDAEKLMVEEEFPFLPLYQYADGYMYDDAKVGGVMMNVRLLTELKWVYRK